MITLHYIAELDDGTSLEWERECYDHVLAADEGRGSGNILAANQLGGITVGKEFIPLHRIKKITWRPHA